MVEPTRHETELGISHLRKRLNAVGLNIIDLRERFHHDAIYFVIGTTENQTDIVLSREFIDDLTNTKDYHTAVDSFARAVAGRLKCGCPEVFYCLSGIAIRVSIRWPIQAAVVNNRFSRSVFIDVTDQLTAKVAKCSIEIGHAMGSTVFDILIQLVNSVRSAIDLAQIKFYEPTVRQEVYQPIEYQTEPYERRPQLEVEQFLAGKAYLLGFLAVNELGDVWGVDPWDAQYLGVTTKELSLALRLLRARGFLEQGIGPEYVKASVKLLSDSSSEKPKSDVFQAQQNLTRTKLPLLEELLRDIATFLPQHPLSALILVDLDHFKKFNDAKGHLAGDVCLDTAFDIIKNIVGRRGRIYKWGQGGDEMSAFLPDFSTPEAELIAEKIRDKIVRESLGGDLPVTASVGVCATDNAKSKSPKEIVECADQAVFESKRRGRNCVTVWPFTPTGDPVKDER